MEIFPPGNFRRATNAAFAAVAWCRSVELVPSVRLQQGASWMHNPCGECFTNVEQHPNYTTNQMLGSWGRADTYATTR